MRPFASLALTVLSAALASTAARADEDPWEVRVRAVFLDPENGSDSIPALAVPTDAIHINSKILPDVDFEYFVTPNWSAELILTYPQTQQVTVEKSALGGPTPIGSFKHLPPILTAKYNFLPEQDFQPYVGVGVNVTLLYDDNIIVPVVNDKLYIKSWSVGPAAQVGFDYKIAPQWYVNADIKWALLGTYVDLSNGTQLSTAHVNPFLFGVGVGNRFSL
jgi:outer membrane protein